MKTYRDYEWLFRDYPWTENGLYVTYVRDATPTAVIEAMTVRELGEVRGLQGINELGWEEFSIVGAAALGNWTIALAPMASAGTDDDLMAPLSAGREALTHSSNVAAAASFILWQDGVRTVRFDPHLRLDPIPGAWQSRMREVGLDPDSEGPMPDRKLHFVEASFAMAANYTGVQITPEFLSTSTFLAAVTTDLDAGQLPEQLSAEDRCRPEAASARVYATAAAEPLCGVPGRGMAFCVAAATNPRAARGTAKRRDPQKELQFASPAMDKPTSAATANQETHFRIANAATRGGVASNRPSPISGQAPSTWTMRSSHRKEDPLSPAFEHANDTSAIVHEAPTHTVNADAAPTETHHTALDTPAA